MSQQETLNEISRTLRTVTAELESLRQPEPLTENVKWEKVRVGDLVRWVGQNEWRFVSRTDCEPFDPDVEVLFDHEPVGRHRFPLENWCEVRLPRPPGPRSHSEAVEDLCKTVEEVCEHLESNEVTDHRAISVLLRASLLRLSEAGF